MSDESILDHLRGKAGASDIPCADGTGIFTKDGGLMLLHVANGVPVVATVLSAQEAQSYIDSLGAALARALSKKDR